MNMINVKNLYHSYYTDDHKKERKVLSNLNFNIEKGKFISVLGRSGCGKTTLANILAGYLQPRSGKVSINNIESKKPGKDRIVVNQENDLFGWMTVWENMKLVTDDAANIKKCLKLVGLDDFKGDFAVNLSGGMKKRLSLARALVVDPKFLILDEPFASLDHNIKENLHLELDRIFSLTKKTTFLVTHDIDEAIFLSDKIIILGNKPASVINTLDIDFSHPRKINIINTMKFIEFKKIIKESYL